ncbi:hypothetical protein C0J50_2216 [Silurus asotus]|uniref:Uncharacterized protein n=1 Tax=Silurus asotus TaxID=30991 RepID=A0AAD5B8G3_SILAS|nr:hypothetical protein C0J50_2216 [Silurus asotus]
MPIKRREIRERSTTKQRRVKGSLTVTERGRAMEKDVPVLEQSPSGACGGWTPEEGRTIHGLAPADVKLQRHPETAGLRMSPGCVTIEP